MDKNKKEYIDYAKTCLIKLTSQENYPNGEISFDKLANTFSLLNDIRESIEDSNDYVNYTSLKMDLRKYLIWKEIIED